MLGLRSLFVLRGDNLLLHQSSLVFEWIVHTELTLCRHLFTFMLFQTSMTYFPLNRQKNKKKESVTTDFSQKSVSGSPT